MSAQARILAEVFRPSGPGLRFVYVDAHGRAVAAFLNEFDAIHWGQAQRVTRSRGLTLRSEPHLFDPNDPSTDRRLLEDRRLIVPRRSGLDRRRPGGRRA